MAFLWIVSCLAFVSAAYGCGTPAITPEVSLQQSSGFHFCGGSLINENWVVTRGPLQREDVPCETEARPGVHPPPCGTPAPSTTTSPSSSWPRPPAWDPTSPPVCLAESSDNFSAGTTCVTSGWGLTRYTAANTPSLLQQASLPLLSNEQCKQHWGSNISGVMICAGGAGATSCMGDSGGPLVCENAGAWTLVASCPGEAAAAPPPPPPSTPRVTELRSWVDQTLAAN
ncbi:hypothetical protein CgunFtcFv8_017068 [Champsocephalus gunnari]|uniref:chymotrypsin n=1 Tax=Champsocephalus gunnari TaxID=52237 RepID=A0AAN8CS27_CHAGU|nr:hypothetical protein CgunFtcFv8_017068 [Champsocephalus gunnari]